MATSKCKLGTTCQWCYNVGTDDMASHPLWEEDNTEKRIRAHVDMIEFNGSCGNCHEAEDRPNKGCRKH